jgi:hypothetical protein
LLQGLIRMVMPLISLELFLSILMTESGPRSALRSARTSLNLAHAGVGHIHFQPCVDSTHKPPCLIQVESMLWSVPSVRSGAPKAATNNSLLGNDTRYDSLRDPYTQPIGEGRVWFTVWLHASTSSA